MSLAVQLNPDQYDIFISYSRKDVAFVKHLEAALKRFTPPKQLKIPQRQLRIFRDESDANGVDYYKAIQGFLEHSSKLVVICSPDARKSNYVNDETQRFLQAKGAANIIPIIVDGLPNNEASSEQAGEMAFRINILKRSQCRWQQTI